MSFGEVNFLAILVAAIIQMIIGAFWYSPKVFGEIWANEMNVDCHECKVKIGQYGAMFAVSLITAWVLSLFVHWMNMQNVAQGAVMGFFIWLGFVATNQLSGVIWGKLPIKIYVINVTYLLLSLVVMSSILAFWK